jgi:methylmalonyl-CoA mutase C-terminal domain/subunit
LDAQVIGLSIHSGAHMTLFPAVVQELKRRKATDIVALKKQGGEKLFRPGTPLQDMVDRLQQLSVSSS